MNADIKKLLATEANEMLISVEDDAEKRLDAYINEHFGNATPNQQKIIEGYLVQAALRIAGAEGKFSLEAEDVKAAIWLFHLPTHPDDPCEAAGNNILEFERARKVATTSLLASTKFQHELLPRFAAELTQTEELRWGQLES